MCMYMSFSLHFNTVLFDISYTSILFLHFSRNVPVFYTKIKPQAIYILNTKLLTMVVATCH